MLAVLLVVVLAAVFLAALLVVSRAVRALFEPGLGDVEERIGHRLGEHDERVDRRLDGLDGRLLSTQQNAGQTTKEIVERLTKLDGTAAQMLARANDLAKLEKVLRPPKARGG